MDFHTFKRRDLQTLCKLNNKPANTTNAAMADALASLPTVEGLEDFLGKLDSEAQGSPERSVLTSPNAPRTTTRRKAVNQELECSKLATTRTRCGTRTKAVEGTDTRKTPATRTTWKRPSQEASIQKKMEDNLQAEFEADMEQIEVHGGELQEISEEVSGVSVEAQSEAQNEVNGGQEVIDVDDGEKNKEEDNVVNELQDEEASEKVDFHSLNRKVLQNLCKKNKIPANMTNAAMADALDSLEIVEGLQEFVLGCDSQPPSSPLMSGINSSCARRSRTTMRSTKEEPRSSKLITKSCRGSRRRIIEEVEQGKTDVPETPTALVGSALYEIEEKEDSAMQKSEPMKMENSSIKASEASCVAEFNSDISNSLMQEAPVIESTVEDNGKGNNGLVDVENLKEPEELVSELDENVVEEEVPESSEVSEVVVANCATQHEDVKTGTAGCELESIEVQHSSNLEIDANSEPEDGQLENLDNINAEDQITKEYVSGFTTQADQSLNIEMNEDSILGNSNLEKAVTVTSDSAAHMSPVEVEGGDAEGDMSEKSDTESATQADKVSLENNVGSESEGSYTEDEMSENSDSEATAQDDQPSWENNVESESEGSCTEDEMSEMSDSEATAQDYQPSLENNVESDSEGRYTEEEMSEKSDSEAIAQDDQPSLEINVEKLENLDTTTDSAADACWVEKPEDGHAEDMISNMFDTESTIQAITCPPTVNDYNQISLRKLKQILKERLQAKTLAKKMDNLTLEETEVSLAKVEEEVQECLVESESAVSMGLSANDDEAPVLVAQTVPQDTVIEDDVGESEEDTNDDIATLKPVEVLLDNEVIPEEAVIGNINVTTCAPQGTPSKCSSMTKKPLPLTPSKSCKTPMSTGRKSVSDDNKENIDNSVTKTEPGKVKIAVTESLNILSPLSMAKLKRDFKLQSEKKKQALQQRSENHCPLASP